MTESPIRPPRPPKKLQMYKKKMKLSVITGTETRYSSKTPAILEIDFKKLERLENYTTPVVKC